MFAFFFQLVAARIITFEVSKESDEVYCVLARDKKDKYHYKNRRHWKGFEFRATGANGATINWEDL